MTYTVCPSFLIASTSSYEYVAMPSNLGGYGETKQIRKRETALLVCAFDSSGHISHTCCVACFVQPIKTF